jgi:site-specific DNA-methyltransferase (cytosine-N4-specific)
MLSKKKAVKSNIFDFDSIIDIPRGLINESSIDIVVTSPPYGDSTTTVAYGQFSALSNQWLGLMENGRSLDSKLMGGKRIIDSKPFQIKSLNEQIKSIEIKDMKRALEVTSFYIDYEKSIKNISKVVKKGGIACYVVSNRNVRGVTLDTERITKALFRNAGFSHLNTFERKISNKRLPRQNSPLGITGEKGSLMNIEYIIVMQKK